MDWFAPLERLGSDYGTKIGILCPTKTLISNDAPEISLRLMYREFILSHPVVLVAGYLALMLSLRFKLTPLNP